VVWLSESLTTNQEVPDSIPGSTVGIFLEGEDSRGDHGLGRLVEFRFKAPLGTTSSSITTYTPSGQGKCASWASQPLKSVTLLPCPGGRTTKSTRDIWWHWGKYIYIYIVFLLRENLLFSETLNNAIPPRLIPASYWATKTGQKFSTPQTGILASGIRRYCKLW